MWHSIRHSRIRDCLRPGLGSWFALLSAAFLAMAGCQPADVQLVEYGQTDYTVVIPQQSGPDLQRAAAELQHYLREVTGADLAVVTDGESSADREFLLGRSERIATRLPDVDLDSLAPDGFAWRMEPGRVAIMGGSDRGTLFGVYAWLEEHLGVRFYAPDVTRVPKADSVNLPRGHEIRMPAFPIRWVHLPGGEDDAWCDRLGIHSRGHRNSFWGLYVHTFETLLPPDVYGHEHPEYYSLIKGQRLPGQQLCLTNPDVLAIVIEALRQRMTERPAARYWSVSQNDRFGPCGCAPCQALVERHGSQAGPLVTFVNAVAAAFPDKVISTLAYQYTRQAPVDLVPAPNVNICLCSIECDRAGPLAGDTDNAAFARDVRQWSALTDNLMIWDYVVQFTNYVAPFPNLHVLQPNIRFFADHGARLMFQQGSGNSLSHLSELKQYLIAKLLWNPDLDVEAVTADFLHGYYGAAADRIAAYLELMETALVGSGERLDIYSGPAVESRVWLTPELLQQADEILAAAEAGVHDRPDQRRRVRAVRLAVWFAQLEQAKLFGPEEHGLFVRDNDGAWRVRPEMAARLDSVTTNCRELGYHTLHERSYSPEQYGEDMRTFFREGLVDHLAIGRPVTFVEPFNPKYPARGPRTLIDGLKGINDYFYSWLGWEAADMSATVDLGAATDIEYVRADFLQVVKSWVWLPEEVCFLASADGETFETLAVLQPQNPDTRDDPFIESFVAEFPSRRARYVRVEATAGKTCPGWHHGAGLPSWIFCDEVIVK